MADIDTGLLSGLLSDFSEHVMSQPLFLILVIITGSCCRVTTSRLIQHVCSQRPKQADFRLTMLISLLQNAEKIFKKLPTKYTDKTIINSLPVTKLVNGLHPTLPSDWVQTIDEFIARNLYLTWTLCW